MGFAAGFGEGFSKAFLAQQSQDAQREENEFSVAYSTFMKNKETYDSDQKRDKKAREDAKRIVNGLPGVSANAWTYAYEWLLAGYTPGQVEDKLTTTKFAPIPQTPVPAAPDAPPSVMGASPVNPTASGPQIDTGPDTANVNIQTQDEFMAANPDAASQLPGITATGTPPGTNMNMSTNPADTQAPPPEVAAPVDDTAASGLLGDLGNRIQSKFEEIGNPAKRQANAAAAANARVMGAAGMDQSQFDSISAGFTPDPVEHVLQLAQATAAGASVLKTYDLLDSGFTPAAVSRAMVQAVEDAKSGDPERMANAAQFNALLPDIKASMESMKEDGDSLSIERNTLIKELTRPSSDERMKLAAQGADVATMASSAKRMSDIVTDLGGINTIGAQGVTILDSLKTNISSVIDVLDSAMANGTLPDESSLLQSFDETMNAAMPGWDKTASAEREFAAMLIRFSYSYAKAQLGQSGNSQSNADIERIRTSILNSNKPEEIIRNLKSLVNESALGFNNRIDAIRGTYEIKKAILLEQQDNPEGVSLLDATLQPLDLGGLGDWASSPTEDIPVDVIEGSPTNPRPDTPVDKSTMKFNRGVLTEAQARELTRQKGRPVSKGQEYRVYEDNSIGVKGFDY